MPKEIASLVIGRFAPPPDWSTAWSWTYIFSLPAIVLLGAMSIFIYPAYQARSSAFMRILFLIVNIVVIDSIILGAAILVWGWPWS